MDHEKNNRTKNKADKKKYYWKFCKISYIKKIEHEKKKIILIPEVTTALQIEDNFYLQDLSKIKQTPKNRKQIKVLQRYNYIPADASRKLIEYYLHHQKIRQEKFNMQ